MKNVVLLHIPHSSLELTKEFKNIEKHITKSKVKEFNYTITDLYADKLFSFGRFKGIKAKYSRICCDMERFADDTKEYMSKYGMGVVYTKTHKNEQLISFSKSYKDRILKKYYYPYHSKLTLMTNSYLAKNKYVILVDCHTFSAEIIMDNKTQNLPDICIGCNN